MRGGSGGTGMRVWLWFIFITMAHFLASVAAFLWSYNLTASRFDGRLVSHTSTLLAKILFYVLWLPFGHALMAISTFKFLPGLWGWLPVVLNSAFLAAAIVAGVRYRRRRPGPW